MQLIIYPFVQVHKWLFISITNWYVSYQTKLTILAKCIILLNALSTSTEKKKQSSSVQVHYYRETHLSYNLPVNNTRTCVNVELYKWTNKTGVNLKPSLWTVITYNRVSNSFKYSFFSPHTWIMWHRLLQSGGWSY